MSKDEQITKLKEKVERLQYDLDELDDDYNRLLGEYNQKCLELFHQSLAAPRRKYAGSLSFDFWPWRDWFRLSLNGWGSSYFQLCVGPLRFDFFED